MGGDLNLTDSVPRLDSPVANAQSGFKSPTKVISWLSPTSQNIFTRRTILWSYHNLCANFFRGQRMIRTLRVHGSSKLTRTLRFSANANEFRPTPQGLGVPHTRKSLCLFPICARDFLFEWKRIFWCDGFLFYHITISKL